MSGRGTKSGVFRKFYYRLLFDKALIRSEGTRYGADDQVVNKALAIGNPHRAVRLCGSSKLLQIMRIFVPIST